MYSLHAESVREYSLSWKNSRVNLFYILKFVTDKSCADGIIISLKNSGEERPFVFHLIPVNLRGGGGGIILSSNW